jgi:hypothetical protein
MRQGVHRDASIEQGRGMDAAQVMESGSAEAGKTGAPSGFL